MMIRALITMILGLRSCQGSGSHPSAAQREDFTRLFAGGASIAGMRVFGASDDDHSSAHYLSRLNCTVGSLDVVLEDVRRTGVSALHTVPD